MKKKENNLKINKKINKKNNNKNNKNNKNKKKLELRLLDESYEEEYLRKYTCDYLENNYIESCLEAEFYLKEHLEEEKFLKENVKIENHKKLKEFPELKKFLITEFTSPSDIRNFLSNYVVGQEEVKKAVSLAVYNHVYNLEGNSYKLPEQHLFIVGPSGSGKTEIFRALKKTNLNVRLFDMSNIAFTGFDSEGGTHLNEMLATVKDGDIVVFDEMDKALNKGSLNHRSLSFEIQSYFLKLLEGEHENCEHCLFMFLGAFSYLLNEEKSKNNFGFNNSYEELKKDVITPNVLMKFGVSNEFLGRISNIVETKPLSVEDFMTIIYNENSFYNLYRRVFEKRFCTTIEIEENFLKTIVEENMDNGLGVRGINQKIQTCMNEVVYNLEEAENQKVFFNITVVNKKEIKYE